MEFEIGKIVLSELAKAPQIEVEVFFSDKAENFARSGNVRIYLDWKD